MSSTGADDSNALPRLVAHRGDMARCPENSLAAIASALEAGADGVEFDVQMNAAGDFVLLHDEDFLRTSGVAGSVFASQLPAPSVHEPGRFGDRYYPQALPRLSDAFALFEPYPAAKAWVEIKQESLDHWGRVPVMQALLAELHRHDQPMIVISYDADAIRHVLREDTLPAGWVLERYDDAHHRKAQALAPDVLVCNHRKIDSPPWPGPWQWMLYDITDWQVALDWAGRGVRDIETGAIGAMADARRAQTG
jgi:glycerophosphoryl diester phosphodiesterase